MENFLPALLIIGGVIYKIYTEYQKEQEKARRRMPQAPQDPAPTAPQQQPQRTVADPMMSVPIPVPPKKIKRSSHVVEEGEKIVVKPILDIDNEKEGISSFDLREAVIQSAILNRPYQ